jgi:hypothetical protein
MAFLHGMQVDRARALHEVAPGIVWSICEVFTDPPPELSPDGRSLAWYSIIKDGVVSFGREARTDVEYHVVVAYADVLAIARFDTRGDPERRAELSRMSGALIEAGRMRVIGDRSRRDPRIGDFHDPMARVTA